MGIGCIGRIVCCGMALLLLWGIAAAANQKEKDLVDSLCPQMRGLISDRPPARLFFDTPAEEAAWLAEMEKRLLDIVPADSIMHYADTARDFLMALHYNADRAGLDPQLVLAVVHVESAFRKYAISKSGAQGYMQVMLFWPQIHGKVEERNLFKLQNNLCYGTVILRHYLDEENGDEARALARYNGSLGKTTYPDLVFEKLNRHWQWNY